MKLLTPRRHILETRVDRYILDALSSRLLSVAASCARYSQERPRVGASVRRGTDEGVVGRFQQPPREGGDGFCALFVFGAELPRALPPHRRCSAVLCGRAGGGSLRIPQPLRDRGQVRTRGPVRREDLL